MSNLQIDSLKHVRECDGCNKPIPPGAQMVFGIESCCGGGCSRVLCRVCIKRMYKAMYKKRRADPLKDIHDDPNSGVC